MMENVMSKLGTRWIKAPEEARAIARGEADPETYRIFEPATPIAPETTQNDNVQSLPSRKNR